MTEHADDNGSEAPHPDEVELLRMRNELLEKSLRELRDTSEKRIIQAELRAEAQRRGMIDLDGLKLIDESDLTTGSDGTVQGVAAVIIKLRRDKPWLFASPSSSSTAGVPTAASPRSKLATEMTLEEWRQAKAELLRRI